jgi:hypothetical protein
MIQMPRSAPNFIITALIAAAVLFLAACGSSSSSTQPKQTSTPGTPGAATTPSASGGSGAGGSDVELSAGDATATVGQEGSVELTATGVGTPGLGAWTVDVKFDPGILSASTCTAASAQGLSFCNPKFATDIVRVVGANAQGLSGDLTLATMAFRCSKAGKSDLTVSASTLADATVGNPTDIKHHEQKGSITCS